MLVVAFLMLGQFILVLGWRVQWSLGDVKLYYPY